MYSSAIDIGRCVTDMMRLMVLLLLFLLLSSLWILCFAIKVVVFLFCEGCGSSQSGHFNM